MNTGNPTQDKVTGTSRTRHRLWYTRPASSWYEAVPIGNGRLGAMVYGDPQRERIRLNEDTLWSGYPRDQHNHEALQYLEAARDLVWDGNYRAAQDVVEQHMLGTWTQSYQPMGDLTIEFEHDGVVSHYQRELDLETAVVTATYQKGNATYTQQVFASAVDQMIVVRISSDQPGTVHFSASLSSLLNHAVHKKDTRMIVLNGTCPSHVAPPSAHVADPVSYEDDRGMRFAVHLAVIAEGGRTETHGNRIKVTRADAATLLIAAATSFNGYHNDPRSEGTDPDVPCDQWILRASAVEYDQLKCRHVEEYQAFFNRTDLELCPSQPVDLPTDERIDRLQSGLSDPQLAALFFQYGRYLLIASSRPGTQPATLQGIWNDLSRPPWCCNYTTNINTQMNYWLAEPCNLAECHTPLFDMLKDLSVTGQATAAIHYGCRGWTAHHGTDLWRSTVPSDGSASWAFWPMAGAWLCQHLWEHYAFSCDTAFLANRAYPIMKGAALFCLDWLVETDQGYLVTCPSTSPENTFIGPDGLRSAISAGSTMDIVLIRDLLSHCIEASRILDTDQAFRTELKAMLGKLPPLQIGCYGQLQEWLHDFEEAEPGHRHVAHIFPLHPGGHIDPLRSPELAAACRTTMDRRIEHEGEDTIGWCFSWNISIFARLLDGEKAHEYLIKLLKNPFPNLLNAHRHPKLTEYPMTLEANYAASAGIAELLLQSHAGEIVLLPALPRAWSEGRVRGLRARGGFDIDLAWREGQLQAAMIRSSTDGMCTVRTATPITALVANHQAELVQLPGSQNVYQIVVQNHGLYRLFTAPAPCNVQK